MKKSVANRIRITKTGKLIRRQMGLSHFKAKKTGKQNRQKRRTMSLGRMNVRPFRRYAQITSVL